MISTASLYEMIGTYIGLEAQAVTRADLIFIPPVIMFLGTLVLVGRRPMDHPLKETAPTVLKYWAMCLILFGFFWLPAESMEGTQVVSAIAERDGAPVQNATQLRNAKGLETPQIPMPYMYHTMVEGISSFWLGLGSYLHDGATRPMSGLMPLNLLLRHRFDSGTLFVLQDWVSKCVNPAMAQLSSTDEDISYEDTLPFPGSPLHDQMETIRVARGRGILNLVHETITCTQYGNQVEQRAMVHIQNARTPANRSMAALWQEELGITPQDAARFTVMREIQMTNGQAVPPPSLMAKYAGIKAIGVLGKAAAGAVGSGLSLWAGAAAGAASGTAGELSHAVEKLGGIVGAAMFTARYGTVMMGWGQIFVHAIAYPLAVLWAMGSPGRHLMPLVMHVAAVAVVYCSPFVWGIIALFTGTAADAGISILEHPVGWIDKQMAIIVMQSLWPLGVLLVAGAVAGATWGMMRMGRG